MSIFLLNYLLCLCCAGFLVLLVLSIMAFCNMEALKIEDNKHIASGIILLIVSIVRIII